MSNDIRLNVDFFLHHKTKKLKRRLGADAVLTLIMLFCYAGKERTDGILKGMDAEDIADAVNWRGEPDVLVSTLCDIGFLEQCEEGIYSIHDWEEHNSWASGQEERQGKARFSRLAQVNRAAYAECVRLGIDSVSKSEYARWKTWSAPRQESTKKESAKRNANGQTQDHSGVTTVAATAEKAQQVPAPVCEKKITPYDVCEPEVTEKACSTVADCKIKNSYEVQYIDECIKNAGASPAPSPSPSPAPAHNANTLSNSSSPEKEGESQQLCSHSGESKHALHVNSQTQIPQEAGIEFLELRELYDRLARAEAPMAGFREYRMLRASRQWPGLGRITQALENWGTAKNWPSRFAPSLARFLSEQWWLAEPQAENTESEKLNSVSNDVYAQLVADVQGGGSCLAS